MNLPNGSEPLVLADGTKINPINGEIHVEEVLVSIPNTADIKRDIVSSRKRISDLPAPTGQMNTISVILSYSLFGINDKDISNVLSLEEEQVINIKQSDIYKSLSKQLVKNILESDTNDVRGMFVERSRDAAGIMFNAMDNPEVGLNTKLGIAKDVLDRGGNRAVDIVEHRHKMEGGLTIEYIEKKDDIPIIDITADKEF